MTRTGAKRYKQQNDETRKEVNRPPPKLPWKAQPLGYHEAPTCDTEMGRKSEMSGNCGDECVEPEWSSCAPATVKRAAGAVAHSRSIHRVRVVTPNDLKLSDCPARRDGCAGECGGAAGVTRGAVRSSAWLGVTVDSESLTKNVVIRINGENNHAVLKQDASNGADRANCVMNAVRSLKWLAKDDTDIHGTRNDVSAVADVGGAVAVPKQGDTPQPELLGRGVGEYGVVRCDKGEKLVAKRNLGLVTSQMAAEILSGI